MSAEYASRCRRLDRLEAVLPRASAVPADCPDGTRLLAILVEAYGSDSPAARRRALQRDLEELVRQERIEAVNPGGKPLRYRRCEDDPHDDPLIWHFTLQQAWDLIAEAVPSRRLDRLWQRLLHELDGPLLDEQRLRIIPDTLRLQPVELYPEVLRAVVAALAQRCALQVLYQDAAGVRAEAVLHPQALVQRGPIPYLFALKNGEEAPLRLYALHRMIRAEALGRVPARTLPGFDLDQAIAQGRADFGQGIVIDLELRVRGYLTTLLTTCPLTPEQRVEEEPEGSEFPLRISARLPSTGQLLRWLLGAGANLEVLAPADLRQVVASQAQKMAARYRDG